MVGPPAWAVQVRWRHLLRRLTQVGDWRVVASMVERSTIGDRVTVGPFAHLRPGCEIGDDAGRAVAVEQQAVADEDVVHEGRCTRFGPGRASLLTLDAPRGMGFCIERRDES